MFIVSRTSALNQAIDRNPQIHNNGDMIQGFFRLLFYFLFIYLVFRIIGFVQSLGQSRRAPQKKMSGQSKMMVKDDVCNTYLPREDALRENRGGREFYFCSQTCRKKFLDSGQ